MYFKFSSFSLIVNQKLLETGQFELMSSKTDEDEHSIEMQLPYIAKVMERYYFDYHFSKHCSLLKGVPRPVVFAIVCLSFCEFCAVSYSRFCGEQIADFAQDILVFVLPLELVKSCCLVVTLNLVR